ncbi:polysaccharide deacetylase family protein [Oribacterium sp. WCC10]|uniref:polysaccharide deacetylase family protein n=1 Tax=Oribacterium sp. WCC10 TaxID=1855343 RepID=UPI00111416FE|nr:polysaccharide deacetylase family protein [Oribacterium sp. WCC10]
MKKISKLFMLPLAGSVAWAVAACGVMGIPEGKKETVVESTLETDTSDESGNAGGDAAGTETLASDSKKIERVSFPYPYTARALTAVNIHVDSESDSDVLGILDEGAAVSVERNIEGWDQFSVDGKSGYVLKKYLIPDDYIAMNNQFLGADVDLSWIDPTKPMIALTFDDGPKAEVTNRILDSLEANGGHATFFMQGSRVVGDNNNCVKRMVELGCELGNHTYTHDYLDSIPVEDIRSVIRKCDYMVEETVKVAPTVFRPPGGNRSGDIASAVGNLGLPMIIWSIDPLDYSTKDPDNTFNVVMEKAQDGDIVLMHDTYEETAEAAERLIPALKEKGFQLVTVTEMAQAKKYPMIPGNEVYHMR